MVESKPKVLVLDSFDEEFFERLKEYCEVLNETRLEETEILIVRSNTRVDRELISRLPNLRLVVTATHGEDHIDKQALAERGILYRTAPVQSYDVAQSVMAYVFAFATNMVAADRSMKRGEWRKKELVGFRVEGKTLGVIGYGRIGREVARQALANGMKVIVYEKDAKAQLENSLPVRFAETLEELLSSSDIITIHVPLNEETRGMIGERELAIVKNGAYLINTARGGIVDEEALLKALEAGRLAGAAIDVFHHQPPLVNNSSEKIALHEKVIASPHSIAQTREALRQKGETVLEIIRNYVSNPKGSAFKPGESV
ncbi:MAG: NAD(P)-binding domain-containing protein [Candidatus Brockarchaeota archaeon]|nr:NAD(P)-binding domain-containing protein [Candidatus Brockarchaeota archaeon]